MGVLTCLSARQRRVACFCCWKSKIQSRRKARSNCGRHKSSGISAGLCIHSRLCAASMRRATSCWSTAGAHKQESRECQAWASSWQKRVRWTQTATDCSLGACSNSLLRFSLQRRLTSTPPASTRRRGATFRSMSALAISKTLAVCFSTAARCLSRQTPLARCTATI